MRRFVIIAIIGLWSVSTVSAAILYVDDSATGANNGTSWQDAYLYLQDALAEALSGDEIRVATGVYRPAGPGGNREISFVIPDGVMVVGGFAGSGFVNPDKRDFNQLPSILSGDLNGDDVAVEMPENLSSEPSRQDNSYHVVKATYAYPATFILLDGFVITGGNANGDHYTKTSGGGIEASSDVLSVKNCIIEFNSALDDGGGCNWVRTLSNCIIRYNSSRQGGGLFGAGSLRSCRIENNTAQTGGGIAHPVSVEDESYVDCVIQGNRARLGGGLHMTNQEVSCTGCVFMDNRASEDGGAIYIHNDCTCLSQVSLNRCKLIGNKATGHGGALYQEGNPQVWLSNSLVQGNTALADGGGLFCDLYQGMVGAGWCGVTNSTIVYNTAVENGGGVKCIVGVPEYFSMVNSILWGNKDQTGFGTWAAQFTLALAETEIGAPPPEGGAYSPITYSCIQGWQKTYGGEGNIGENPLFKDAHGSGESEGNGDGDYHLKADSPCIDAGTNSGFGLPCDAPSASTSTGSGSEWLDLDGNPRIIAETVDMGAYEYQYLGGTIIYVDDDAVGANTGTNWGDAFRTVQDALAVFKPGDEICIAQGIYAPAGPDGPRDSSFVLADGMILRGGFAGYGTAHPDDRDADRYKTILSGDLMGNDTPLADVADPYSESTRSDNCYHLLRAHDLTGTVVLEGLIVTGGYSIDAGVFGIGGSGLWVVAGDQAEPGLIKIEECRFIGNVSYDGGAVESSVTRLAISRSVFAGNLAERLGGAICLWFNYAEVDNSIFACNAADDGGGIHGFNHRLNLRQCTFSGNMGGYGGGAIHSSHFCQLDLTGCILWGNHSSLGSQIWCGEGVKGTVAYCDVDDLDNDAIACEWPGYFVLGPGNTDIDPLFADVANYDYHLKSQAGRWDPAARGWVQDEVTSPCIDTGNPASAIMFEPFPNGGMVNMGAYGGTAEASKSRFDGPVCEVITAGDINGDCKIDWADFAILAGHWSGKGDLAVPVTPLETATAICTGRTRR